MSTSVAIGFSQADDPQEAAYQASLAVKNQLNNPSIDMVILFTSPQYAKQETLDVINSVLKPVRLVGGSSIGLILPTGIFDRGVAILAINSTTIHFGVGAANYSSGQDFRRFGFELSHQLTTDYKSSLPRRASIIFSDSHVPYSNQFMLGAQDVLGHSCAVTGALCCNDFKLKKTYQFHQQQLLSRSAVGCIIGSDSQVTFSSRHGFKPLGKPRTVTSVEGPIIRTIDHKPAVHIYEEFLKDDIQNLKKDFLNSPATLYPLGIYLETQGHYLLRYPVDILDDGSIVCQSDVPPNTEVHLTINNRDSCIQAAASAAMEIKKTLEGRSPQLLIIFESIVRHKILGRHLFSEIQTIKETLGDAVPIIGMCSFGEFCHLGVKERNSNTYLQNGSLLLVAMG